MHNRPLPLLTLTLLLALLSGCGCGDRASEGPFEPADITLKESGELKELVDNSLKFHDSNDVEWTAPKGTLTDGASVPRLFLPVTDGRWDRMFLKAAVLHDCYCQTDNKARCRGRYRTKPWQQVHRMFYEACLAGGTPSLLAKIMFSGVWLGGPRWDEPDRNLEDAPGELLTLGFTAVKHWIEENNPTIEEIEADFERREPLLLELHDRDMAISAALSEGDLSRAKELLGDQEKLLKRELYDSPDDLMLINFQGYWHKNSAMLYRDSGMKDDAADALRDSEEAFSTVLRAEPVEPSALNGLGRVSILRGDLDRAEEYVLKALTVAPRYQAAVNDLKSIERLREAQAPP